MEYRELPHGTEKLSVIGLGLGNIHTAPEEEAERALRLAMDSGINFFDLCCSRESVFPIFARASAGRRDRLLTQMHFGAVYRKGEYGFSRSLDLIRRTFERVLKEAGTDYTDFGYLHCVDEEADFRKIMDGGLFDYVRSLKSQGVVRHIGFSTHTPAIAKKFLETGEIDLFMFSINPAFDYTKGEYAYGETGERAELYAEAEKLGVGITVMKPFAGGQLLDERRSPIGLALTKNQCIQYALDRPAVLTCLPGVGSEEDVRELLGYFDAPAEARDYSVLGKAAPSAAAGRCVYCNHCAPCPQGINVGLVNKYYDLAKLGDKLAAGHYRQLSRRAEDCTACGHCDRRCPFGLAQSARMSEIRAYFGK